MTDIDGRTRHYGGFYGIETDGADRRPLWVVYGNCQAEALRIMLDSVPDAPYRTVRMPAVHELEATDVPHLQRLVARVARVLAQPVADGYRDLPLGTGEIAAWLPAGGRLVRWPVIQYAGLFPFQVTVRHPSAPAAVPDGVPYHDVRTILAARDGRRPEDDWDVEVTAGAFRAVAEASAAELRRREDRDTDVGVADLLGTAGSASTYTINHPGNVLLQAAAERILAHEGQPGEVPGPDRILLSTTQTPLERRVLTALGLDGEVRTEWWHDGSMITADEVHRTQLAWYVEHPQFVEAGVTRHRELIETLGLST